MKIIKYPLVTLAALLLIPLAAAHATDAPNPADNPADQQSSNSSAPIRITVDAANPQWQISRYLTGMHFVYGFERPSLYQDEHIADWMRRSKVGIIRWPGGTAVQTYHWDQLNGISFGADTWDPGYKGKPAPLADYMNLDEYIAFCRRVGAEPMVGVNIGSGRKFNRLQDSLNEAKRLIQYCKDKDYKVRHWYIGNECYKGWSPEEYARTIDLYAGVLRSVDPNIVIIGDWKFGPTAKHRFEQAVLIANTSKQINVMEIHEKWGNEFGLNADIGKGTLENWQHEPGIYDGKLDAYISTFLAEMKAAGKDVKIAFNEWGAGMDGNTSPFNIALVDADYLITLFRHPVYSACDWNLNMGPAKSRILVTTNDGHTLLGFNPAAHIFELCAPALGKQNVPMTSSDRFVYGFAAKDAATGGVQIYLLNKRPETATVKLAFGGKASRWTRYDVASFVEPGVVHDVEEQLMDGNNPPVIRLAPLSFNRITLDPAAK
jgi:hypothetical protein